MTGVQTCALPIFFFSKFLTFISDFSFLPVIGVLGGSGGASSVPAPTLSPSQSRDSSGGDGSALENGGGPGRGRRGHSFTVMQCVSRAINI